jgi:hypothetical protein
MKMSKTRKQLWISFSIIISAAFVLAFAPVGIAAEKTPDCTLELHTGSVAVGIGFQWGAGTLTCGKEKRDFKITGLSVVDVGISKATASGKVYNLKKMADFSGNYTAVKAAATIAGGAGVAVMENQNGVRIELKSTTQGLQLSLAPEGVNFKLK